MNIAYVGNHSAAHCTEVHLTTTLRNLGHMVVAMQEDQLEADRLEKTLIMLRPQLFLWTRTWGIHGNMWECLKNIHAAGIVTASYHLDLYIGLPREKAMPTEPWWKTKYVFTPDGGHADEFRAHGVNHFYVRPGVFRDECYMATPRMDRMHDVVFVGSRPYHPEWPYRARLLDWLGQTYGPRFAHYGLGGRIECLRGHELNEVYSGAKVVVGDSLCKDFKGVCYWSDRITETLGRGGFLIHPFIEGMETEFHNGKHLLYYEYDNFKQLRELIDSMVHCEPVREQIRAEGHRLVKNSCTYHDRMRQMLSTLAYFEPTIKEAL